MGGSFSERVEARMGFPFTGSLAGISPRLRYELAGDGGLDQARQRCHALLQGMAEGRGVVEALVMVEGPDPAAGWHRLVRSLDDASLVWAPDGWRWERDAAPVPAHCTKLPVPGRAARVLLEAWSGADFGGWHGNRVHLVFFEPDRRLLLHPYDDRGADLCCPESAPLRALLDATRPWILDHDRERIARELGPGR